MLCLLFGHLRGKIGLFIILRSGHTEVTTKMMFFEKKGRREA